MASPTLRQFVERAAKNASSIFEKEGQLRPMYHIIGGAGNELVLPAPPGDKDQSVAMMRSVLASLQATRVAFLDEAWMLETKAEGADCTKLYREGLENHPGRTEALLISAEDQSEGVLLATREIFRHGHRAVLGKLKISNRCDQAEGRMIGLLPPRGRVQ